MAPPLLCDGHLADISFKIATDAHSAFEWEPFVIDALDDSSPLYEQNVGAGDAIVR